MTLQFIIEGAIGPKERKLIRSHVMMGKNAGKPRPKKKALRNEANSSKATTTPGDDRSKAGGMSLLEYKHDMHSKRLFWNDMVLSLFPLHVSPKAGQFVYQWVWDTSKVVYSQDFCTELNLNQYAWFQDFLEDKAFLHCLLALAASFTDYFGGTLKMFTPEAAEHISQAYRLMNERLSGSEPCSDKAIAVVTVLAIYQRMYSWQSAGLVHFKGLQRMIQLRGGLAKLAEENRTLAQKPWRLDVEFALQDGSRPRFSPDEMPSAFMSSKQPDAFPPLQALFDSTALYRDVSPELVKHLLNITAFAQLLNETQKGPKLDPMDYSESVTSRLHRLLHFAPVGHQQPMNPLDNLVHASLVATMASLMPEYGRKVATYDLLARHLRKALETYAKRVERNDDIFLWAMFVGFAKVLNGVDHGWLVSLVQEVCIRSDLHAWEDVRLVLCRYPWIGVLYDKPGLKLWNMVGSAK